MNDTLALLRAVFVNGRNLEQWVEPLENACLRYGINNPARLAMFIAQVGHESDELRHVRELWGPTPAQLRYEGREALGNTEKGDGYRYRGRGLIQITGRANYADCSKALFGDADLLLNTPELLEQPHNAAMSAGWFWNRRRLSVLADAFELFAVTKAINGGLNGIEHRTMLYDRACRALAIVPRKAERVG